MFEVRSKVDGPKVKVDGRAKVDGHLSHSGRSMTIVDGLSSQSARSK